MAAAQSMSNNSVVHGASITDAGNIHGRSKLDLMRKQFISKQAERAAIAQKQKAGIPQNGLSHLEEKAPQHKPQTAKNLLSSMIGKDSKSGRQQRWQFAEAPKTDPAHHEKSKAAEVVHANMSKDHGENPPVHPARQCVGEVDIRERLSKQHMRRPIHRGAVTYRIRNHVKPPLNAINSGDAANENILSEMRRKGPMVVINDVGVTTAEAERETKGTNGLIQPSGRGSPRDRGTPSPINHGQVRGRNSSPLNRPPSPNTDGVSPYSPEDTAKKIARVMKARLYLLQQNGPNSFRIGDDTPERTFRVIVGPQTCSCGKQFCFHILFVMLRVFKLDEGSPLLWRKELKNFEVESLLLDYHERCKLRISPKRKLRMKRMASQILHGTQEHNPSSNSDYRSSKGEEENCPICLLQMIDDEPITVCEVGCRNKLHTHCVDIWAEECRRNRDSLKCPLCRVVWKPADTARRPIMVEIPSEYVDTADSWARAFDWELVECLFSSHPNIRENGLRRLAHDITGSLLTTQAFDVSDANLDDSERLSTRGATTTITNRESSALLSNVSLSCCCSILAMACVDPEYRVYVTALRTLKTMLAYIRCRSSSDVKALQELLLPVVDNILLKCSDGAGRALQLSVSSIVEICKGQSGELAVGKKLDTDEGESLAVGGVDYILSFLEPGRNPDSTSWQWMLGRLNALSGIVKEFREISICFEGITREDSLDEIAVVTLSKVIKFAADCLHTSKQSNVVKMACEVFVQAVNLGSKDSYFMCECTKHLQNLHYPELQTRVARFLPSDIAVEADWVILPGLGDGHDATGSSATMLSLVLDSNPAVGKTGLALSSAARILSPVATSHRATFPSVSFAKGVMQVSPGVGLQEGLGCFQPDPVSLCEPCVHLSSSDDNANLADEIQVSSFRSLRSMSLPSVHFTPRQPTVDSRVLRRCAEIEKDPLSPPPLPVKESVPQTENSKSAPVTPASPGCSVTPSVRRQRPMLLKLKSEASAFRYMKGSSNVASKDQSSDSEMSVGRESNSSTLQDCLDKKSGDRRLSVKELAETINGKKSQLTRPRKGFPISPSGAKTGFRQTSDGGSTLQSAQELPTMHPSPPSVACSKTESLLDCSTFKNPLVLAAKIEGHLISRAVARRGTMERYKERKRLEGLSVNPPQIVHEVKTPDLEHAGSPGDYSKNPPLNLYSRSAELSPSKNRLPMRGILKNAPLSEIGKRPVPPPIQSQVSISGDSGMDSMGSTDRLSEVNDLSDSAFSSFKSSDELSVFPAAADGVESEAEVTSVPVPPVPLHTCTEFEKPVSLLRFENVQDSLVNHHSSYPSALVAGQPLHPMRPKQLKRNAKSPTREARLKEAALSTCLRINPTHNPTGSVPSKNEKESSLCVSSPLSDEDRMRTSTQLKPDRAGSANASESQLIAFEDLQSDGLQADKSAITFKSEIGECITPGDDMNSMGNFSVVVGGDYSAVVDCSCSCQAHIAEEESKLFARALAISYEQDALPTIPHLSYTEDEKDVVRNQDEGTDLSHEYRLNQNWVKGHQIGVGALSCCFQARDVFTGTLTAVKQINYQRLLNDEQERVLEEIAVMRHLSHPNIVRLHGATKEMGVYNIFFEWCAGGSVSALLSRFGPFTEPVISNYTLQVLRGLSYLHERHIVHRDIKGANLLIDSAGQRLRIGDFGVCARLATKSTGAGEFRGQLLGTVAFMAPEVLRGENYGRSCDIWGCGCVVVEMATGKPPWEVDLHSNQYSLIFKIANSTSTPVIPDHLSPALRDLCKRCHETDPSLRPTAEELLKHPVFICW